MEKTLRKQDFRLGRIHGKLQAENDKSEAQIQRTVFLSQKVKIWRKRNEATVVRIFGYEVPLKTGCTRGECVDLMGYDKDFNLYLIELKKEESTEKIPDIIKQLDDYEQSVKQILPYIESEFRREYFLPIEFKKEIKKMILAPKEFYKLRLKYLFPDSIEYAYFGDRIHINKRDPGEEINIHLVKVLKSNIYHAENKES